MFRSSQIAALVSDALCFLATWHGLSLMSIGTVALMLRTRYQKYLRDIPGPFWASILPFDRLSTSVHGQQQQTHIEYHERYGPFVRVGPNHVSISRGEYITQIYGIGNAYLKVSHIFHIFHNQHTPN